MADGAAGGNLREVIAGERDPLRSRSLEGTDAVFVDGRVEVDNNTVERGIRPIPIFATIRWYSGVYSSGMISLIGLRVWRRTTAQRHGSNRARKHPRYRTKTKDGGTACPWWAAAPRRRHRRQQ